MKASKATINAYVLILEISQRLDDFVLYLTSQFKLCKKPMTASHEPHKDSETSTYCSDMG